MSNPDMQALTREQLADLLHAFVCGDNDASAVAFPAGVMEAVRRLRLEDRTALRMAALAEALADALDANKTQDFWHRECGKMLEAAQQEIQALVDKLEAAVGEKARGTP